MCAVFHCLRDSKCITSSECVVCVLVGLSSDRVGREWRAKVTRRKSKAGSGNSLWLLLLFGSEEPNYQFILRVKSVVPRRAAHLTPEPKCFSQVSVVRKVLSV